MGYFKKQLMEETEKALEAISNGYDEEAEVYLCNKYAEAYELIEKAFDIFTLANAVWDEYVEDNSYGIDSDELWEKCEEYDEEFPEIYEAIKYCEKYWD